MGTILILGAGLAGASVAWHLSRQGLGAGVVLLEREASPGTHATSENAAMVRALPLEPELARYAVEGVQFWNRLPEALARPGAFRRTGSLLLASDDSTLVRLRERVSEARGRGLTAEMWDAERCRKRLPVLAGAEFRGAAFCAEDGVGDPVGLLDGFLRGARVAGATIRLGTEAARLWREDDRVRGVVLRDGRRLDAACVVLAAGAWAPSLLRDARLDDHGLAPHRRHLFCTLSAGGTGVDAEAPFVWHVDGHAYFRFESGGILFSACDADVVPPRRATVAAGIEEVVGRRLGEVFPFLLDVPIARAWAGLRTYRPDHRFVLGRDRQVTGLFHAIGLGGHGVTCAGPVGREVAAAIAAASGVYHQ